MPSRALRQCCSAPSSRISPAALAKAEQRLEQFRAPRADQSGEAENFARPHAEARVLGEAGRAEMRDLSAGSPAGAGGARRIEREQVAPDHQPRHVDRLELGRRPRRDLLAVAQHRDDVGDRFDLLEAMRNVEDGRRPSP